MVTKAIERAQTTVEQKNAEARKNVLKYDEVMNEQRKVIYRRRNEILNGADLRGSVLEAVDAVVDEMLETFCAEEMPEDWDLTGLLNEVNGFWPSKILLDDLDSIQEISDLERLLKDSAVELFESRERDLGVENLREVERQVMLRIIDQRWREHLYEMDHLRDGIHLRAMAQKDPTTEWQREGFELFQELTEILRRDLVRYIMRVQVSSAEQEERIPEELETSGPVGPVSGAAAVAMAAGVPEEVKESRKIVTQQ